ncbi:MAG: endonuclease MutS2 [Anaerolineae bacterium]|nr:endonuclease MutS2 [Anaerolineae bacterium]
MNRHWDTLEYPLILGRLADYTDFSGGTALVQELLPTADYRLVQERLRLTREARSFLTDRPDFALGGIFDIRPLATQAVHGVTIVPSDLLQIRDTLMAADRIHRLFRRLEVQMPGIADIAWRIVPQPALVEAIAQVVDDRGEIRDNASPELSRIRHQLQVSQNRVQDKLRQMLGSPSVAPYLQESLITRREGRFVIPVRAEAKGRIQGVVHDRSGSGVTLFIEPLAVVELNNALRELRMAEEEEIHRLLSTLTYQVGGVEEAIAATIEALSELDLTFAKARYADATNATEPEIIPVPVTAPEHKDKSCHPGTRVRLMEARHPLLAPDKVVPIDIVLDEDVHVLVITGPNTGGKTVTLKTMGLMVLMAQAGMHIPVGAGSVISCFEHIYVDIGDEQSIEQNLSTFSGHLSNILSFLEEVDHRDLVLLDELGAGTDPAEGSALARSLLESFRERRCTALVATHYPELKLYAHNTPGVHNAAMQFDTDTLSPTYHLLIGLPGRSNAFAIARRLGMPESVVKDAQAMLSGETLRAEDMLDDLHNLRIDAARLRDAAHKDKQDALALSAQLRRRLEGIEKERLDILRRAEDEAQQYVEELREETRTLRRKLRAVPPTLLQAQQPLAEIESTLDSVESQIPEAELVPVGEIIPDLVFSSDDFAQVGDTVRLVSLGMQGTVVEITGDEALVQAGPLRTRVDVDDLELVQRGQPIQPKSERISTPATHSSPGIQLDLRGQTTDNALQNLDRYLDSAALADLPWVRIVHGKGTGVLRREVRQFLQHHPLVASYEVAGPKEGGEGATVARLVRAVG